MSSSLESLQTAVHEATQEEEDLICKTSASKGGMVRGRGCNDSFRAAVDRSYEQPMDTDPMEPCMYYERALTMHACMHLYSVSQSGHVMCFIKHSIYLSLLLTIFDMYMY